MFKSVFIVYMFLIIGHTVADGTISSSLDVINKTCEKASKEFSPIPIADVNFKNCSKQYTDLVFFDQPADSTGCDTFDKYNASVKSLLDEVSTCYDKNTTNIEYRENLVLEIIDHIWTVNVSIYKAAASYLSKKTDKSDIYSVKKECFNHVENNTDDNITQSFMSDTFPLYVLLHLNMEEKTCTKAKKYTECIQNSTIDNTLKDAVNDMYTYISKNCYTSSAFSLRSGLGFLLGFLLILRTY